VANNLAMMHVYYKKLHFMRHTRGELYGILDFFSNIGGLLGLCMGFSALSVVEFIYFFTLRLFFNICSSRTETL
jgi:amiloride-sensitive sodium channel